MALALGAACVAFAQAPSTGEDFRGYLDQARFFLRKGWYEDAARELEKAVAHPDGWVDPEAWFMLASVRLELLDIDGARDAAARAHTYSRDEDQLAQAAGLSSFVDQEFGVVTIRAPQPGLAARLEIELLSLLFDPTLTAFLERVEEAHRRREVLPVRIGLPVGSYRINGEEVEVGPQGAVLNLPSSALGVGGFTLARLTELEVGAGMANWVGGATYNLRPSLDLHVAISVPLGPLRVAAVLDWIPTSYTTITGPIATHPAGGSIGAQVGWPVRGDLPIVVRPSIGYRYGLIPGIELTCVGGEASFTCGAGGPTDLLVYAVGRAHIPYLELDLSHLDARRTMDVGFGVKGLVEGAFGLLPATGTAKVLDEETSLAFAVPAEARAFNAVGLRVIAHFSVAF